MGDRLYVSGLPYAVTEAQLQELFAAHGTVASARIVTDRFTGRSRGFGFVEMGSDAEAQAAMEALNGTELQGRVLK
ncbi:MAG: RNA-binding protein, partial [Deltaproteobacteria bacterium]|nr:RNA-binding protein [Deltaproteobacteria bacterium]